jgi:hypothetical protein
MAVRTGAYQMASTYPRDHRVDGSEMGATVGAAKNALPDEVFSQTVSHCKPGDAENRQEQ